MPFARCPTCGDRFHLVVREDLESWYSTRGIRIGVEASELCFGCWRDLKEYDVVEVIAAPSDIPGVEIGDIGAVLIVHQRNGNAAAFEVECVLPDGRSKWVGCFMREHLRYRADRNKNAEQARSDDAYQRPC